MITIQKYVLQRHDEIVVNSKHKLLTILEQNDSLVFYFEIDDTSELITLRFERYGTGWEIDKERAGKYIATVQLKDGYEWHIYESQV